MLKILQVRLQQYLNPELPDVQGGFRKGRGTREQIANICWIMEKAREFQKNMYFCFMDYAKSFDCVDHNKLLKILKEMGIPDHFTCLPEKRVSSLRRKLEPDMEQWIGSELVKGVCQGCILSPCLFNLCAQCIMQNVGWMNPKLELRLL